MLKYWKSLKFSVIVTEKHANVNANEGYFENPWYRSLEGPVFFLLALKWNLLEKAFFCVAVLR